MRSSLSKQTQEKHVFYIRCNTRPRPLRLRLRLQLRLLGADFQVPTTPRKAVRKGHETKSNSAGPQQSKAQHAPTFQSQLVGQDELPTGGVGSSSSVWPCHNVLLACGTAYVLNCRESSQACG